MKRITVLLLAMAMVVGSVVTAEADGIDIKVKGQWDFAFGVVNNRVLKESANWSSPKNRRTGRGWPGNAPNSGVTAPGKRRDNDNFSARQRVRTQINFISSEYLQAVLMFEIGDLDWGSPDTRGRAGGQLDSDGVNVETKRAYLDWIIPNTEVSVRMGIQGVTLPSTRFGNMILSCDVAGIVISSPITDWLSITAFWVRPFDQYQNDADGGWRNDNLDDEADIFGIVLPFTFDGFSISPYFLYGNIGTASGMMNYAMNTTNAGTFSSNIENSSAKIWYLGGNFKLDMFDPLVFNMDVIYGHLQNAEYGTPGNHVEIGSEGWYIGATLDYKFSWGTPGIFGWYATGDDYDDYRDDGMLGRLPAIMNDGGNFKATSFGMNGFYGIGNGYNANVVSGSGTGMWGIGIQVADVSFIQDLKHTLRFAYYRGTNDEDMVKVGGFASGWAGDSMYLTKDDSVFEVNFDHKYKIYENLEACLELGYLHLRSDKTTWGWNNVRNDLNKNDDAWKAEVNFRYSF